MDVSTLEQKNQLVSRDSTSNTNSRFDEVTATGGKCKSYYNNCLGGVARIKYVVDQIKIQQKEDNLIFLNAGDFFQVKI